VRFRRVVDDFVIPDNLLDEMRTVLDGFNPPLRICISASMEFQKSTSNMDELLDILESLENIKRQIESLNVSNTEEITQKIVEIKNKLQGGDEVRTVNAHHTSSCQTVLHNSFYFESLSLLLASLENFISKFQNEGSGFILAKIKFIDLTISKYRPLRIGSNITLPKELKNLKQDAGLINPENEDEFCILWSLLMMGYSGTFENISTIEFPIDIKDVKRLAKFLDISINVYAYETKELFPIILSKQKEQHFNLLLIEDHFMGIKDFNKFVRALKCKEKKYQPHQCYYCTSCLSEFRNKNDFDFHSRVCEGYCSQTIKMLPPDSKLKFNVAKIGKSPFVVYCDFECSLVPIEEQKGNSTTLVHKHVVNSFCYVCINHKGDIFESKIYCATSDTENVVLRLIENLQDLKIKIFNYMLENCDNELAISKADAKKMRKEAKTCVLCTKDFSSTDTKVIDHSYVDGSILGVAHSTCNIRRVFSYGKIPIFFHNLKSYDSHFIIAGHLPPHYVDNMSAIAESVEKFKTFTLEGFVFKDSLQFLNASLASLVKSLNISNFKILQDEFPNENKFQLVLRKGIYPYEYVSTVQKFKSKELPSIDAFKNSFLKPSEEISQEDYLHAQNVWTTFECKTFEDYHKLYLKTDTYLLACVFESFRDEQIKLDGQDPSFFISLPSLAFNSALRMARCEISLLTDETMYLLFEKNLRGGICQVNLKYAEAENKLLNNQKCPLEESYIFEVDFNNLYGYAQLQALPASDFRYLSKTEVENFDIFGVHPANKGYSILCDLKYPPEIHEKTQQFPFCPETSKVTQAMLSQHQLELLNKYYEGHYVETTKLLLTHGDKKEYFCYIKNLQFYLHHGMVLEKIHAIIEYTEIAWLRDFIEHNTEKRKLAKSDFLKNLFKLANNSCYGKCCEGVRKRFKIKICDPNGEKAIKALSAPNCKSFNLVNNDLLLVSHKCKSVTLNKPIFAGFQIVEISKLLMYRFFYEELYPRYGNKHLNLLAMDTDSFIFKVTSQNIISDLKSMKHWFLFFKF
jgi:hypothetical protein